LFTASGAVWGILSVLAIQQEQYRWLFLWVGLAIFVDGFDGFLARRFHTKVYAPEIDGSLLDNILDYFNYTIVATLLIIQAHLVPAGWELPTAFVIALSSALQFSQAEAKTDPRTHEYYFKGFPSYWNVLAVYLLVLDLNPWFNLLVIAGCIALTFVPIKFIYPSRTSYYPKTNLVIALAWGASSLGLVLVYPAIPPLLTAANLVSVGAYLAFSLAYTLRRPPGTVSRRKRIFRRKAAR
jgi:phosphatidylcholine synthase